MVLQEARGDGFRRRLFDRLVHDAGFMFAEGHEEDAAGVEDAGDAHREGVVRHVLLAEEAVGGVAAGDAVECNKPRAAILRAAGFVEGDVSGAADAENLDVDAAVRLDGFVVGGARCVHLVRLERAVGDVNVLRRNVYVIEQRFVHPAVVGMLALLPHRVVFIEVERDNTGQVQPFVLV